MIFSASKWPLTVLAGALAISAFAVAAPATSSAENLIERTGDAIGGVATSTGKALGSVAESTGQAVGQVACGIGEGAEKIVNPNAANPCGPQTVDLPDSRNPNVNPAASTEQFK